MENRCRHTLAAETPDLGANVSLFALQPADHALQVF